MDHLLMVFFLPLLARYHLTVLGEECGDRDMGICNGEPAEQCEYSGSCYENDDETACEAQGDICEWLANTTFCVPADTCSQNVNATSCNELDMCEWTATPCMWESRCWWIGFDRHGKDINGKNINVTDGDTICFDDSTYDNSVSCNAAPDNACEWSGVCRKEVGSLHCKGTIESDCIAEAGCFYGDISGKLQDADGKSLPLDDPFGAQGCGSCFSENTKNSYSFLKNIEGKGCSLQSEQVLAGGVLDINSVTSALEGCTGGEPHNILLDKDTYLTYFGYGERIATINCSFDLGTAPMPPNATENSVKEDSSAKHTQQSIITLVVLYVCIFLF